MDDRNYSTQDLRRSQRIDEIQDEMGIRNFLKCINDEINNRGNKITKDEVQCFIYQLDEIAKDDKLKEKTKKDIKLCYDNLNNITKKNQRKYSSSLFTSEEVQTCHSFDEDLKKIRNLGVVDCGTVKNFSRTNTTTNISAFDQALLTNVDFQSISKDDESNPINNSIDMLSDNFGNISVDSSLMLPPTDSTKNTSRTIKKISKFPSFSILKSFDNDEAASSVAKKDVSKQKRKKIQCNKKKFNFESLSKNRESTEDESLAITKKVNELLATPIEDKINSMNKELVKYLSEEKNLNFEMKVTDESKNTTCWELERIQRNYCLNKEASNIAMLNKKPNSISNDTFEDFYKSTSFTISNQIEEVPIKKACIIENYILAPPNQAAIEEDDDDKTIVELSQPKLSSESGFVASTSWQNTSDNESEVFVGFTYEESQPDKDKIILKSLQYELNQKLKSLDIKSDNFIRHLTEILEELVSYMRLISKVSLKEIELMEEKSFEDLCVVVKKEKKPINAFNFDPKTYVLDDDDDRVDESDEKEMEQVNDRLDYYIKEYCDDLFKPVKAEPLNEIPDWENYFQL